MPSHIEKKIPVIEQHMLDTLDHRVRLKISQSHDDTQFFFQFSQALETIKNSLKK